MSDFSPLNPRVVLAVAAHPDDIDFGMAGSIAAWAAAGARVYYLILTNGNKGTADTDVAPAELTATRRDEQREAARRLGVSDVYFCDYEDGELEVTMAVKRDIVRVIRQVCPDVVMAMDPSMLYDADRGFINHPDHRAAGHATLDAVYPLARDHLSLPELYHDEHLEPHKTRTMLLVNFASHNFYVDISKHLDAKLEALAAHASQIPDMDQAAHMVTDWAEKLGREAGVRYAEAFVRIDLPD